MIKFQLVILAGASATRILEKRSFHVEGSGGHPSEDAIPDLHDTQFCSDISSWGDVVWTGKITEKCNTTFVKKQKNKSKKVTFSYNRYYLINCTYKITNISLLSGNKTVKPNF